MQFQFAGCSRTYVSFTGQMLKYNDTELYP